MHKNFLVVDWRKTTVGKLNNTKHENQNKTQHKTFNAAVNAVELNEHTNDEMK